MSTRVLIIEDDNAITQIISLYLRREGFCVEHVSDGTTGFSEACNNHWDLVILDVMLPGQDGFEICRKIRAQGLSVPVLFLTARTDDVDQVLGLGLGADDYIAKPFSPVAVVARVKAHLRRYRELMVPANPQRLLRFDGLSIDLSSCEVVCRDQQVSLTAKEFELLSVFASNPGRVLTREQLYLKVWGELPVGADDTVTVHIRRLREKIELMPSQPQYILTVRGLGYRFAGVGIDG